MVGQPTTPVVLPQSTLSLSTELAVCT